MKKLFPFLICLLVSAGALAQDFTYGDVSSNELDMKKYDKDTSAHALVLNEYGKGRIVVTNSDDVNLLFNYHVRIKFFDDKEFERYGTQEIPLYSADGLTYEKLDGVKAVTYYKDEGGNIQRVALDPKKMYSTVQDKHHTLMKFAMPALRKGCVVDIQYDIESPFYWNHFHTWIFQDYIPKLNSRFEAFIPGFWNYTGSLRGYLKLTENKADVERECFAYHGASCGCSHLTFGMQDIPAFVREEYMTSRFNYLSGIYFQLVEFTNLNTGAKQKYSKDWKDIDRELKEAYYFGTQLKRKDLLKDRLGPEITKKTDTLEKAKAVYAFIQKSFKWNEIPDYGSVDGIRKAMDAHTGNAGDINLALVAALSGANIPAHAVLLSTRDNGTPNKLYPTATDFDYVVAQIAIGGKTYLLDATDPFLSFGMLPMRCLNDQGRVFSLDKPSYWMDMSIPQKEVTTYNFDLTLQDDGKLKGTIKRFSIGYDAYLRRKEIKKFNSVDEYVEHVESDMGKAKILKSGVENIDSLEMPIAETYEVEIPVYSSMNHDRLTFNPFLLGQIKTNPFKLASRDYPVDWGMPSEERYIITIHLPSQYAIENPPQAQAIGMANQGGRFVTDYQADNNTFTFSYVTQFNKSIYAPEEYSSLKELYNKIILTEKNEMVFKKK